MVQRLYQSEVESVPLTRLESLGWHTRQGAEIAAGGLFAERQDNGQVVLEQRLRDALLPKLIRGETRVKDAERFLKERGL